MLSIIFSFTFFKKIAKSSYSTVLPNTALLIFIYPKKIAEVLISFCFVGNITKVERFSYNFSFQ